MAQSTTVMAFRKRLKSYGYKEIQIKKIKGQKNIYAVRATEPLGNEIIRIEITSTEMHHRFR